MFLARVFSCKIIKCYYHNVIMIFNAKQNLILLIRNVSSHLIVIAIIHILIDVDVINWYSIVFIGTSPIII